MYVKTGDKQTLVFCCRFSTKTKNQDLRCILYHNNDCVQLEYYERVINDMKCSVVIAAPSKLLVSLDFLLDFPARQKVQYGHGQH